MTLPLRFRQADALSKSGRTTYAVAMLTDLILRRPDVAELFAARGFAYSKAKRRGEGLADLQRAQQLAPDEPQYPCSIGFQLCQDEEFRPAIEAFTKALELGKVSESDYYTRTTLLRAAALIKIGDYRAARADCRTM